MAGEAPPAAARGDTPARPQHGHTAAPGAARTRARRRRRAARQHARRVAPAQAVQRHGARVHAAGQRGLLAEEHEGAPVWGEAGREGAAQLAGQAERGVGLGLAAARRRAALCRARRGARWRRLRPGHRAQVAGSVEAGAHAEALRECGGGQLALVLPAHKHQGIACARGVVVAGRGGGGAVHGGQVDGAGRGQAARPPPPPARHQGYPRPATAVLASPACTQRPPAARRSPRGAHTGWPQLESWGRPRTRCTTAASQSSTNSVGGILPAAAAGRGTQNV